jgi:hypothetical protein
VTITPVKRQAKVADSVGVACDRQLCNLRRAGIMRCLIYDLDSLVVQV